MFFLFLFMLFLCNNIIANIAQRTFEILKNRDNAEMVIETCNRGGRAKAAVSPIAVQRLKNLRSNSIFELQWAVFYAIRLRVEHNPHASWATAQRQVWSIWCVQIMWYWLYQNMLLFTWRLLGKWRFTTSESSKFQRQVYGISWYVFADPSHDGGV